MALAGAVSAVKHQLRDKELFITLTPTGNYVTGGDTVNLTALTNPKNLGDAAVGFPGVINEYLVTDCPAGYTAKLIPGGTLATWLLKVFETGAALSGALAELAAAAYPAGILAATFGIKVAGPKGRI